MNTFHFIFDAMYLHLQFLIIINQLGFSSTPYSNIPIYYHHFTYIPPFARLATSSFVFFYKCIQNYTCQTSIDHFKAWKVFFKVVQ